MIQRKLVKTKELLNGCICCTLTGPFLGAIDEILDMYHPDRILIEASGTADTAALALMLNTNKNVFRDGVVSIIDLLNFDGFLDLSQTARTQTQFTDVLVFNKRELVDETRKRAVLGYVRELNTHSPIVEAINGKISKELIFGLNTKLLESSLNNTLEYSHRHLHEDHIQAINVEMPDTIEIEALKKTLETLPKNVFRVKGLVRDQKKALIVVQKVGSRLTFEKIEDRLTTKPFLIVIGFEVEKNKLEILNAITPNQVTSDN